MKPSEKFSIDSLGTLFELLSEEKINNVSIRKGNDAVEVSIANVQPTDYEEMLIEVLEYRGVLPRTIRSSLQRGSSIGHAEQAISLFTTETDMSLWLRATILYDADKCTLTIFIALQANLSNHKIAHLITNIQKYTPEENDTDVLSLSIRDDENEEYNDQTAANTSETHEIESKTAVSDESHPEGDSDEEKANLPSTTLRESPRSSEKEGGASSSSSKQRTQATTAATLLIDVTVTSNQNIQVVLGKTRTKTQLGKAQGEHVTAYALLLQSIVSTIDDTPIDEIPKLLVASTQFYLLQENISSLQAIEAKYEKELKELDYLSRAERKALTHKMREDGHSTRIITATKAGLKCIRANFIARMLRELASEIISQSNLQVHATFLSRIKKSKKELGEEGSRVKLALQALKALNNLLACVSEEIPDKKTKLTKNFLETSSCTQGLNQFKEDGSVDFIQDLLEIINPNTSAPSTSFFAGPQQKTVKNDELTPVLANELCQLTANLFDFNYYRRMSADLWPIFQIVLAQVSPSGEIIKQLTTDELAVIAIKSIAKITLTEMERAILKETEILSKSIESIPMNTGLLSAFKTAEVKLSEIFIEACCRHFGFIASGFEQLEKCFQDPILLQQYSVTMLNNQGWLNSKSQTPEDFSKQITSTIRAKFSSTPTNNADNRTMTPS